MVQLISRSSQFTGRLKMDIHVVKVQHKVIRKAEASIFKVDANRIYKCKNTYNTFNFFFNVTYIALKSLRLLQLLVFKMQKLTKIESNVAEPYTV